MTDRSPPSTAARAVTALAGGQKQAAAERIERQAKITLKFQAAGADLAAAEKHLADVNTELAKLEAREGLADEPAAIEKHLRAEEVARVRVGMAEKRVAQARAWIEPMQAEMDAISREAAYCRALDSQREVAARFPETYAAAASALFNILAEARAIDADGNRLVKAGPPPDGVEPYSLRHRFSDVDGPVTLRVQLIGLGGGVVWEGGAFSDGVSDL